MTLSATGETRDAPAVESRGNGDVRAWYYQTSGGGNADAWNVWYRTSTDGGATWSAAVKISDATGGAAYKTPAGFGEVYGDYGEIAITNTGKTIADLGRGRELRRPGRGLDQPPELIAGASRRADDERAQGNGVDHERDREVADRRLDDAVEVLADRACPPLLARWSAPDRR